MRYERRATKANLVIFMSACMLGSMALVLGFIAYLMGEAVRVRYIVNGAANYLEGLAGVLGLAVLVFVLGYLLILFVGMPLWMLGRRVFSPHWLVAACSGLLCVIFAAGVLVLVEGIALEPLQLAVFAGLGAIIGVATWWSAYRISKT